MLLVCSHEAWLRGTTEQREKDQEENAKMVKEDFVLAIQKEGVYFSFPKAKRKVHVQ